jgi:effector-binding domain-containing protein
MKKLSFVLLFALLLTGNAMATEEPKYEVLKQQGDFELRRYEPMLIAETWVTGSMDNAGSKGFRIIADFIFGNNTSVAGERREIAMTAPVTMQSEEIAMTAPVTMAQDNGRWRVHFVMPSRYTYEMLPKPNNPAVNIREITAKHYAVIQFSGFAGEDKVAAKTLALLGWMQENQLEPQGLPEMARYNPPWTLPFFRRNEVMIAYNEAP